MQLLDRNAYLNEMGIQSWYPATLLVNAPIPIALVEAVEGQNTEKSGQMLNADDGETISVAKGVLAQAALKEVDAHKAEASLASAENAVKVKAPNAKPIRFALGLYAVGQSLVVSTLTPQHGAQQQLAWNLIQSILRSFCDEEPTLVYHHVISWPFFQNPQADQGKKAAGDYVASMVNHLMDTHSLVRIVSFGGVLPTLNGWVGPKGLVVPDNTIALPSVYKMLADASEKAKAWQIIKRSSFYESKSSS